MLGNAVGASEVPNETVWDVFHSASNHDGFRTNNFPLS